MIGQLQINDLFSGFSVTEHCETHRISDLFGHIELESTERKMKNAGRDETVNKNCDIPSVAQLGDLSRLHYLMVSRKVFTALEFGSGKSTVALADAMRINYERNQEFSISSLRRDPCFKVVSVEASENWANVTLENLPRCLTPFVELTVCPVSIGTFGDRVCTFYHNVPNVCPDLIYLDGPDQYIPTGSIRGVHTREKDRMPMAADILVFEHFLCPGTLIVVDGRTANARFLKANLQRNWLYLHDLECDQHFFELAEAPLGRINSEHLHYSLGSKYFDRIGRIAQ